jgi:hypothetical protein
MTCGEYEQNVIYHMDPTEFIYRLAGYNFPIAQSYCQGTAAAGLATAWATWQAGWDVPAWLEAHNESDSVPMAPSVSVCNDKQHVGLWGVVPDLTDIRNVRNSYSEKDCLISVMPGEMTFSYELSSNERLQPYTESQIEHKGSSSPLPFTGGSTLIAQSGTSAGWSCVWLDDNPDLPWYYSSQVWTTSPLTNGFWGSSPVITTQLETWNEDYLIHDFTTDGEVPNGVYTVQEWHSLNQPEPVTVTLYALTDRGRVHRATFTFDGVDTKEIRINVGKEFTEITEVIEFGAWANGDITLL